MYVYAYLRFLFRDKREQQHQQTTVSATKLYSRIARGSCNTRGCKCMQHYAACVLNSHEFQADTTNKPTKPQTS